MFLVGCSAPVEDLNADEDLTAEDKAVLSEVPEEDGAIAGQSVNFPTKVDLSNNLVNDKLKIEIAPGWKGVYKRMWLYKEGKYAGYVDLCKSSKCNDIIKLELGISDFNKIKIDEFVPANYEIKLYIYDSKKPVKAMFGPFTLTEASLELSNEEIVEEVAVACVDSDVSDKFPKGKNHFVKGAAKDADSSTEDGCATTGNKVGQLKEAICINDFDAFVYIDCSSLSKTKLVCQDGACVEPTEEVELTNVPEDTPVSTSGSSSSSGGGSSSSSNVTLEEVAQCTDTDGGIDISKKGVVTLSDGTFDTESCYTNVTVRELSCGSDGSIVTTLEKCLSGTTCQDAVCVG